MVRENSFPLGLRYSVPVLSLFFFLHGGLDPEESSHSRLEGRVDPFRPLYSVPTRIPE